MPKIDDMIPTKSKFLKKEDVGEAGVDLIIAGFEYQDVGKDDDVETKLVINWTDKNYHPMVCNKENGSRLKMTLKTDDTDQMIGRAVNVYSDPYVAFGGKTVGGLRIRTAKSAAPVSPQTRSALHPPRARHPQDREGSSADDTGPPTPPLEAYQDEPF